MSRLTQIHILNRAVREANDGCKLMTEQHTSHRAEDDGGQRSTSGGVDAGAYGVITVLAAILEKYVERSAAVKATSKNCICPT